MKYLISIVTPSYNASQYIAETITSIKNQTYINWELLITDDCSMDSTWQVINKFAQNDDRIKVFRLDKNSGPGVARNNSIKHALGRYIAFCDSDDQWIPDKLEKQIQFMQENDLALSYSSYKVIDEEGKEQGYVAAPRKVTYQTMLRNNYIGCLTVMYDTSKVGKVYMPEIRKRQDWALWLSMLKKVPYALGIQENLAIYRDRSKSISSNKLDMIKYNWNVYRKAEGFSTIKATFYFARFLLYYIKKKI